MFKILILVLLFFPQIAYSALIKSGTSNVVLSCDKPAEMSDGSKIPAGTKIKITLYGSSDQEVWFKLKTSKFCKFKVKSSELSTGKIYFSATATIDKKESNRSNSVSVDVEKKIDNLIKSPESLEAK